MQPLGATVDTFSLVWAALCILASVLLIVFTVVRIVMEILRLRHHRNQSTRAFSELHWGEHPAYFASVLVNTPDRARSESATTAVLSYLLRHGAVRNVEGGERETRAALHSFFASVSSPSHLVDTPPTRTADRGDVEVHVPATPAVVGSREGEIRVAAALPPRVDGSESMGDTSAEYGEVASEVSFRHSGPSSPQPSLALPPPQHHRHPQLLPPPLAVSDLRASRLLQAFASHESTPTMTLHALRANVPSAAGVRALATTAPMNPLTPWSLTYHTRRREVVLSPSRLHFPRSERAVLQRCGEFLVGGGRLLRRCWSTVAGQHAAHERSPACYGASRTLARTATVFEEVVNGRLAGDWDDDDDDGDGYYSSAVVDYGSAEYLRADDGESEAVFFSSR